MFTQQTTKLSALFIKALALFFLPFTACERENTTATRSGKLELPIQEGWNQKVQVTKNGQPTAIIHYGHMHQFSGKTQTRFDQKIEVKFFSESGMHTSTLTAEEGLMDEIKEDLRAFGNVLVKAVDGRTMRTDSLRWDNQEMMIFADSDVVLTTEEGDTLYGRGFESTESLDNWKMTQARGVTGKPFFLEGSPSKKKSARKARESVDSTETGILEKARGDSLNEVNVESKNDSTKRRPKDR